MVTVNISQLMSAIEEAGAFRIPDMSVGTDYLYNQIYRRLAYGDDVRLSEINYDNFGLGDVDSIREIYTDVLEANESKADALTHTLRNILPAAAAATFV